MYEKQAHVRQQLMEQEIGCRNKGSNLEWSQRTECKCDNKLRKLMTPEIEPDRIEQFLLTQKIR